MGNTFCNTIKDNTPMNTDASAINFLYSFLYKFLIKNHVLNPSSTNFPKRKKGENFLQPNKVAPFLIPFFTVVPLRSFSKKKVLFHTFPVLHTFRLFNTFSYFLMFFLHLPDFLADCEYQIKNIVNNLIWLRLRCLGPFSSVAQPWVPMCM